MSFAYSASPPELDLERLLSSLTAVLSASVVAGREGRLLEIHVLATSELHPKQIVRNVESALRAGFGIDVDRRIISVAQVPVAEIEHVATPETGSVREEPPPISLSALLREPPSAAGADRAPLPDRSSPTVARLVIAGYEIHRAAAKRVVCTVRLRGGDEEWTGEGQAPDTQQGRVEAAARAVLNALTDHDRATGLGLEGAATVSAHGRRYVIVAAWNTASRPALHLAGAAAVAGSTEEAAILATLQATNRWLSPANVEP